MPGVAASKGILARKQLHRKLSAQEQLHLQTAVNCAEPWLGNVRPEARPKDILGQPPGAASPKDVRPGQGLKISSPGSSFITAQTSEQDAS